MEVEIDQKKLSKIMDLKQFKTPQEAVDVALSEYLRAIICQEILSWKGSNAWEGDLEQMRLDKIRY